MSANLSKFSVLFSIESIFGENESSGGKRGVKNLFFLFFSFRQGRKRTAGANGIFTFLNENYCYPINSLLLFSINILCKFYVYAI